MTEATDSSTLLYVKNWEKFQHYKTRNPPWIKLHRLMLDDHAFMMLALASRGLLMLLWILASEGNGSIPNDPTVLAFRLRLPSVDLKPLIDSGLLIIGKPDASMLQADATPSVSLSVSESVFEGGSAEGGILVAGMSITEATAAVRACHPDFARVPEMAVTNALRDVVRDGELTEDGAKRINDMALHYAGASMRKPIGHLVNYLNHQDRKAMTGGSDLTEYKRTEGAVAEAMWDTLDLKPTKDELRRAIKALHDKYRDTPKSEAGKDPVAEGINRAMNNKRKRK